MRREIRSEFRLRSLLINMGLIGGSLLFCFVLIEVGLRITYGNPHIFRNPQVRHIPTAYGYKPEPNQKKTFTNDKLVTTNAAGFRDTKEWEIPKPEGVYRILIMGDSFTFGNGVNAEDRFSNLIEKHFQHIGKSVEVLNASAGGWNLDNEYFFFYKEGLTFEPDALVVAFFPNDWMGPPLPGQKDEPPIANLSPEGRWDARPSGLKWLPYEWIYKFKYSATVMYLRDRIAVIGTEPDFPTRLLLDQVVLDDNREVAYSYLKYAEIKKTCDKLGIPMVIAAIPPVNFYWLSDGKPAYIEHFQKFAETNGIIFLDLSHRLRMAKKENIYYMYPWDNHLNPMGHQRVANQLIPVLDQLIQLKESLN